MPGSYVGGLGGANGSTFSEYLTFTTSRDISAGDHVVVCVRSNVGVVSVVVGSLSLSADYTGIYGWRVWSARATVGIASGATVTVTLVSQVSGGNKDAIGELIAGIAASSYVRASAGSEQFASNINVGNTDTTPLIGDVAIIMGRASSVSIISATSPFVFGDPTLSAPRTGYDILDADGAVGGSLFALSASADNQGGIVVYAADAPLDACLPDADIITTGWATAPLFSKINDASDATVITATAS